MWWRVFGQIEDEVRPSEILQSLADAGLSVTGRFKGDDLGWTGGEIDIGDPQKGAPLMIERYLAKEDDIRDDLNSWAAWLEAQTDYAPQAEHWMGPVIQTKQLVTLRRPVDHGDEVALETACQTICQFLSQRLNGFFQADNLGLFTKDGTLVLQEY